MRAVCPAMMWIGISGNRESRPLSSASSDTIVSTFSRSSSSVAASVARPWISALLAVHTPASSSQSARTRNQGVLRLRLHGGAPFRQRSYLAAQKTAMEYRVRLSAGEVEPLFDPPGAGLIQFSVIGRRARSRLAAKSPSRHQEETWLNSILLSEPFRFLRL